MKKILTSVLILALTVGAAQAQTTENGQKSKQHRKEQKMAYEELNLTEDQKARMKAIREDFKKQSEELKNNKQLSADQLKARRQELHQAHKAQVAAILTTEQKAQLDKMKSDKKTKSKNGKFKRGESNKDNVGVGNRKGQRSGADLKNELNLTAEQEAKMTQIRSEFKTKANALRTDNSLSKEQKREKMTELMNAQQEQVKTILTKEQIEKMHSLRKERSARNTK